MVSLPMHTAIVFQCVWQGGYVTGRMSLGMGPVSSLACVSLWMAPAGLPIRRRDVAPTPAVCEHQCQ